MKLLGIRVLLLLVTPIGLAVFLNARLKGWENGTAWWIEWRDIWKDQPPSKCYTFRP